MEHMLSLAHNPWNPFTQYDLWALFDRQEGFDTAGFLARVVSTSPDLSEADQELDIENAIDNIIANPSFKGLYKKVSYSPSG